MSNKRFWRMGAAVVFAVLLATLLLAGCRREQAEIMGLTHFSGPIDITGTGSASAPALYFAGDSDSGFYRSAANNLDWATGGTQRMNLSSSGLDMKNNLILNVGAAGTDFTTGGLSAAYITATTALVASGANGLDVSGGDITLENDEAFKNDYNGVISVTIAAADEWIIAADEIDATNGQIVNIGAAGTDFSSTGGLTLADALVVSSGGVDIQGGDLTLANDETLSNSYNGVITYTATTNFMSGALQVSGLTLPSFADETITNGEWLTPTVTIYALDSAGWVTMTLGSGCTEGQYLELIGDDANNIFINDTNIRTSDGNGVTLNQYDVVGWRCQDNEWLELFLITNS